MNLKGSKLRIEKIDECRYRIPKTGKMRVDGVIYVDQKMMDEIIATDESLIQVANVAHLPGIQKYSLAMPDIHWGYGFPIGGVAAMDVEQGVISPGGVGYDINCGCRLLITRISKKDIKDRIRELVDALFKAVPCGVGSKGKIKLSKNEEKKVLEQGSRWAVKEGFGTEEDIARTEEGGMLKGADPNLISERALERGKEQLGTLGAGNHFLEIGYVEEIFDEKTARAFNLFKDQVTILIHCGSRGLGHQICDDFIRIMMKSIDKLGIELPDRQLVSAYIKSKEGQAYLSATATAANFAWANRQIIMHWVREAFSSTLAANIDEIGLELLYDVCHNIAKIEEHEIDGKKRKVCVHRKGATRAFPPKHPDVPKIYREVGQPVLIPGDMGTESYVLVGTQKAMEDTFGSTCHGAGRIMSRSKAIKFTKGRAIQRELENKGIIVKAKGSKTLKEEAPEAYKDVSHVVDIVHKAGISKKVARIKPLGVVKG
ncbi:MAG: RNA-splicing ligase RtcB [Spirochaetes bacterium]|nr:MAG: RNA-splicing ligase RtcB [Spirochaetota bacterium]